MQDHVSITPRNADRWLDEQIDSAAANQEDDGGRHTFRQEDEGTFLTHLEHGGYREYCTGLGHRQDRQRYRRHPPVSTATTNATTVTSAVTSATATITTTTRRPTEKLGFISLEERAKLSGKPLKTKFERLLEENTRMHGDGKEGRERERERGGGGRESERVRV